MACYRAYGHVIESDFWLRLPTAVGDEASPRVIVASVREHGEREGFRASVPGVCSFVVHHDGVEVVPLPVDDDLLAAAIVGPVLALWFRAQGYLSLHASAVVLDGRALAFVGHSGAGKSTLARAFLDAGARLLADDVVLIDPSTRRVLPAYPELRLWPPSIEQFEDRFASAPLRDGSDKRAVTPVDRFADEAVPLSVLGVLDLGDMVGVDRLSGAEAFVPLLANTWEPQLLGVEGRFTSHLDQIAALTSGVPTVRARRTDRFEDLPILVDLLLATAWA